MKNSYTWKMDDLDSEIEELIDEDEDLE